MNYQEKNQAFLAFFWDLALDDQNKRLNASRGILEHVARSIKTQKGMNEEGNMTIDLDYTVKRLVRGLSSSRDSARHGFATCLSKLLSTRCVDAATVLAVMEDSTKITGKMKGSEERDLMFGKLFSYLALARSGLLADDENVGLEVIGRLLELHKKRNWMREVVSEAILVIMWSMPTSLVESKVLKLLANTDTDQTIGLGSYGTGTNLALADTPLEEYQPWQLQLVIGLQRYASEHGEENKNIKKQIKALCPGGSSRICTHETLSSLQAALLGATAGFPKIHRVWDYVLGQIFGMEGVERGLPTSRVATLTSKQLSLLKSLVTFIETQLMPASHERRSLAYRLVVMMTGLCPAAHLPEVLSPVVLRGMTKARVNKKHLLNRVAARSIIDMVNGSVQVQNHGSGSGSGSGSADDAKCRLLIAAALVQHGGGGGQNFDSFTSRMLGSLMDGLDYPDIQAFVVDLVSIVVSSAAAGSSSPQTKKQSKKTSSKKDKKKDEADDGDGADSEEENEEDKAASAEQSALAAIDALTAIMKMSSLKGKGDLALTVVCSLMRVGCFGAGKVDLGGDDDDGKARGKGGKTKGKPKGKGKADDASSALLLPDQCLAIIGQVEQAPASHYSDRVVHAASSKLLMVLSDLGTQSVHQLNGTAGAGKEEEEEEEDQGKSKSKSKGKDKGKGKGKNEVAEPSATAHVPLAVLAVKIAARMLASGVAPLAKMDTSASSTDRQNEDEDEDEDEDESARSPTNFASIITNVGTVLDSPALSSASDNTTTTTTTTDTTSVSRKADTNVSAQLRLLLSHACLTMLAASADISPSVEDLLAVCPKIATAVSGDMMPKTGKAVEEDEDEDEDDEEDDLQEMISGLLDCTLDLVSLTGDGSITTKGIRDASKRLWSALGRTVTVTLPMLEAVMEAVIGDDVDEDEEEEEEEDEMDVDGKDASDDGDEDENIDESAPRKTKGKGKGKGKDKGKEEEEDEDEDDNKKEKEDEEEEEDDDDEVIDAGDALDLLAAEENSDSEEELGQLQGMVTHTESSDAALAAMIEMRKANRKSGLLLAKRKQCVIRSRALDILESLLVKVNSAELLMPLLPPLLVCVRKLQVGLVQSLQEGRAFEERLRLFVEAKFCKKHFTLLAEGDEEVEEGISSLVKRVTKGLQTDLTSSAAPMRRMAQAVLMCVTRAVVSSDVPAAVVTLGDTANSLFSQYLAKKNSRISSTLFDEYVSRYPDFTVTHLLPAFVQGPNADTTKGLFLRAEGVRLMTALFKRFSSLRQESKSVLRAASLTVMSGLDNFLRTLTEGAGAGSKRIKPVLQCVREYAALPICKHSGKELQALFPAAAPAAQAKGEKKGKKRSKDSIAAAEAAEAAGAGGSFVSVVSSLAASVKLASEGGSGGGTAGGQDKDKDKDKSSSAVANVGAQALAALGDIGVELNLPTQAQVDASPAKDSKKKKKKLSVLEEEEQRYIQQQQRALQGGDEDEGGDGDAQKAKKEEPRASKWFDEPTKQERRKKKRNDSAGGGESNKKSKNN